MESPDIVGGDAVMPDAARPPGRQCGRCRAFFAAEPGVDPVSLRDWWACAPCHAALFPKPASR